MRPSAAWPWAALATLGCTTSFDLSTLPIRDASRPDVVDAPPPSDLPIARDASDVIEVSFDATVDVPVDAPPDVAPDLPDVPAPTDTLRCGGLGDPCCAPDARADACDRGFACDLSQRCARCAVTERLCSGRCVDTASDAANCGACGVACGAQFTCQLGRCVPTGCAPGFDNCDAASGCATDLNRSSTHCGRCGVSCARPNAIMACVAGRCTLQGCTGTFANCDGDPANGCESALHNDAENCGACGRACAAVNPMSHVRRACVNGVCQRRCQEAWYDCNGDPSDCEIGVVEPLCMSCNDPRCNSAPPPPDGRERRCCAFMRGTVTCCSQ